MPTRIMGTTIATIELTMLLEALTNVIGTDDAISGAILPFGDAILPLYAK